MMEKDELLKQIKDSMRIKHSALDSDIQKNIKTALLDLKRIGVQLYDLETQALRNDALINKAIELYCKGESDYQGKGLQYMASYEKLRDSLGLCGDYNE